MGVQRDMVTLIAMVAFWLAIDMAMAKSGHLFTLQLLERTALPSLFLAWIFGPPLPPFPEGYGKIMASKAIALCCRTVVLGMLWNFGFIHLL